nr:MAG TPA: hypothetical protein [Caudoviricetes sp.]
MADQAINALSTKTTPETSDQLLLVGAGEPQLIDYDKLADSILNKITSKNYALDAGQMTLLAALNKLNSESSISLCKVISGENTFSSELKGKSYKAIIGFFYEPSDNPFSFGSGYFIAFQATYLQEASSFVIIGASLTGIIENKFVKLK